MKHCTKCGVTKSATEFYKDASKHDGLSSSCKVCKNAANAKWNTANPEKFKAYNAKWLAANSGQHKAAVAKWQAANPEKLRQKVARWRAANPDAERIHAQNRRARNVGTLSKGLAAKLFKLQRGKCACGCKRPLGDDYHMDHRMPLALGGTNTDENIQLLTATCNRQKSAKHPIDFMHERGFLL
jgi:5-methylcytosine-specific restriction endonuclease McrA